MDVRTMAATGMQPAGAAATASRPAPEDAPGVAALRRVLSVGEVFDAVVALIARRPTGGRDLRVRGIAEIDARPRGAGGPVHFALTDTGGRLPVFVPRVLAHECVGLSDGATIVVRGDLGVYRPRAVLQLVTRQVSLESDGDRTAERVALRARLAAEGLFRSDTSPEAATVPAPHRRGDGGHGRWLGRHQCDPVSALAMRARARACSVQWRRAPASIADALARLYAEHRREALDSIVVGRGAEVWGEL
jgi:exonuclease VII large subunit